jgi:hypothetical protein
MARSVGDELVLLDLDSEVYFGLDPVGAAMWKAVCELGSLRAAHRALGDTYEIDEDTLWSDLQEIVGELVEKRLLQVVAD